ncbi:hypothetical protein DYY67_0305 [Candidatus Nitrosotalea sp. TS]|nr:hypothetical protein [Candidatus Nitrosotalea sp. TS]
MLQTSSSKTFHIVFRRDLVPKIASVALIVMLFASSISVISASAQVMQENDCSPPLTTTIDSNYQGPVVVDAYWVDQGVVDTSVSATNPIKKEVGPGEGAEVFAVVLNNRGDNPLNSVTAYLNLPAGFAATGESKIPQLLQQYNPASKVATSNFALASYYGQVAAGGTFILFFDVDVLDSAKVGTFGTNLVVNYKIGVGAAGFGVQSCTSALLEVPFVLPGKVIMDISTDTKTITAAQADPMTITVLNKGSAPATGVVATITNLGQKGNSGSGSTGTLTLSSTTTNLVNLGANQFNLGVIPANSSAPISITVFPATSAAGQTQDVSVSLVYENAWGKQLTTQLDTGIFIAPVPPQSLSLAYAGNNTSPVITSGNLSNLNFVVSNNGTNTASNVVISLVPSASSTSVSVVGQSTWSIPTLAPGEQRILSTSVFAANSLIDTPTSFTLTANYVSQGQTNTNSLTLGAFVIGDVKPQLYGLAVNYVGNTPNLAGSLLNQGSTTGLYTTVQLYKSPILQDIRAARMANMTGNGTGSYNGGGSGSYNGGGSGSYNGGGSGSSVAWMGSGRTRGGGGMGAGSQAMAPQFLGDLTPDSPIPFSIPLNGINSLQPGSYPVSFKVVYADDLKIQHFVVLNGTVSVGRAPQTNTGHTHDSILDQIPIPLPVLIGIIIAAIAVVIVIRRRKSKKQKMKMLTGSDTDIVTALDSPIKK